MTMTIEEKIAVMEAFRAGKPIEAIWRGKREEWLRTTHPSWDWHSFDYRVALTKPSWDWSHVSEEINFLVRQSPDFGGKGLGLATRPEKTPDYWVSHNGFIAYAKFFTSYDPGTCDWWDSLVVRPGYVEADQ